MYDTQVVLLCCNIYCCIFVWLYFSGMSDLGLKWGRLAPSGTHPGLFQIRCQYILARCQDASCFCIRAKCHSGAFILEFVKFHM